MTRLGQFILSILPYANATYLPESPCKAFPGTHDWPSKHVWDRLNDTLEGKLLHPDPPAAACHSTWPQYNSSQCQIIKKEWAVYEYHSENPISVMWDQYTNDTCLPNEADPCSARGYPAYVINATTPEDVKLGVDFARNHNVRLVVKNTGHDFIGRSIAPGSLSIWTHHLNSTVYHRGDFKPDGSDTVISGNAITAGAGAQMYDLYTIADRHNETVVGGGAKSVGLGGYITGGGHSILSPRFGLAADQVFQMEVVAPSGEILTVNEYQHSDLFWALRGGGGSTFGVITSITLKTYPTPKILSFSWLILSTPDFPHLYDLLAYTLSTFPSLGDAGLSGYAFMASRYPNPIPSPGAPKEVAGIMGEFILQDKGDAKYLTNLLSPINQTIQKRWPGAAQVIAGTQPYNSFLEWFDDHYDQGSAGNSTYLRSRLLDKHVLEDDEPALANAIKSALGISDIMMTYLVSGKGVHNAKPPGGSDSVNPGWRTAYVHAIASRGFLPLNETSKKEAMESLEVGFEPFRELAPTTGAYVNEAYPFEEDFQHTFWGDNYERLLSIKRKVDPHDVFWCTPCVGNERWRQLHDGRLCKV